MPASLGDRSEMTRITDDRIRRQLDEAEGYLMLDLPRRALQILDSRTDWSNMQFEASLLKGEALLAVKQYREALKSLEVAAGFRPGDPRVALALGWCYKRTNRLAQAIDSLARALRDHPDQALLHYNLACYWSLAGNTLQGPARAFDRAGTEFRVALAHRPGSRISIDCAATPNSIGSSWAGRRRPERRVGEPDDSRERPSHKRNVAIRRTEPISAQRGDLARRVGKRDDTLSQFSSRIRWVISRSQTLHHFQRWCPMRSSRCFRATRTERNQIFVSFSPTFSSLAHRAKWSKLEGERPEWPLPLDSVDRSMENESDGFQPCLEEFLGGF